MNAKMKIAGVLFGSLLVCTAACKKDDKDADKGKEKEKDTSGKVTTDKDKTKEPDKTTEPAKTLTGEEIAAWYQQCWGYFNDKKWDDFKGCYADDVVSEAIDTGAPPAKGPDAAVGYAKTFAEAFPDIKGTPALVLVNGNNVVGAWHIAGTHTAPLKGGPQEVPATNKKLGLMMVHGVEANASGKVVKEWSLYDGASFMGQLGLMPEGVPFRAATEAPASPTVVIAKNDDVEKKNLEAYNKGVEAFNKHDLEAFKTLSADNLVWSEQAMDKDQDKATMLKGLDGMWKAFSDIKLAPASIWAAGEYVVAVGTMSGTNDGDMPGTPLKKTGKPVTMQYVEIAHFDKDARLDKGWLFFNSTAMAMQLGLMDAKPEDKKSK
jgi:predicted ester cyclase